MRLDMWSSSARMIADHPLAGVGAGAWEHEADFYAHNEFIQLVAEYGVAGWVFLVLLAVWLARSVRGLDEWRGPVLCSLVALFIVSNAGFPWHLAMTGAMLGVCIGSLAVRDSRDLLLAHKTSIALSTLMTVALLVASYATLTAARAESRLSRAASIALSIGTTSNPNDPRWTASKSEMLRLVDEGMRLHPDDRQLAPLVADELGRWGDWPNAIRIWEYVLRAHPNRVVVLTNVARGYVAIGRPDLANVYLERALKLQPDAPSVRAVETLLRQMSSSKG
jgi:tetratricopeptide (TPR) repeat protein